MVTGLVGKVNQASTQGLIEAAESNIKEFNAFVDKASTINAADIGATVGQLNQYIQQMETLLRNLGQ